MTSQDSSRPKTQADKDNVPGSEQGDTPQAESEAAHRGGTGADPELPKTTEEDDDGGPAG